MLQHVYTLFIKTELAMYLVSNYGSMEQANSTISQVENVENKKSSYPAG